MCTLLLPSTLNKLTGNSIHRLDLKFGSIDKKLTCRILFDYTHTLHTPPPPPPRKPPALDSRLGRRGTVEGAFQGPPAVVDLRRDPRSEGTQFRDAEVVLNPSLRPSG